MGAESALKEKIRLPMILLCFYILAVPLTIIPMPGGVSLLKVVTIADVAIMIPLLFIGDNEIKLNSVHLIWMLYMIYSISTLFWLRDESAIDTFRGLAEVTALAMLVSMRVYNSREKRIINNAWLMVGAIMVLLMLFSSNVLENSESRETIELFGNSEDPNQLTGYFILPIAVCLERIVEAKESNKLRLFYIFFILVIMYFVLKTGSRGGLIAIVGTVFMYITISVKGIKNKFITIAVLLFIVVVFWVFILPFLPESIMERFSLTRVMEDKASNRFDIWRTLIEDLLSNISGFTFGKGFSATAIPLAEAGVANTVAHNHIIQVYYDQGLMGGTIFIAFLITGFARTYRTNRIIAVALFGMMILGMGLTMYPYYKPFWNVLTMTALNFAEEEEKDAEN